MIYLAAQIYTRCLLFCLLASYFASPIETLTSLAEIFVVSWEVVPCLKRKKPDSHGALSLLPSSEISGILGTSALFSIQTIIPQLLLFQNCWIYKGQQRTFFTMNKHLVLYHV